MPIFDRIDPLMLDRRDTQLWILASAMILILTSGLAVLMYPAVFNLPMEVSGPILRRAFLSFCVLSLLFVGYLTERHLTIRHLRRDLVEEHRRNLELRDRASADILSSLPGLGHFQDRLSMEFRRASRSQMPLSLLVIQVHPSERLGDPSERQAALADAAKTLMRKLRGEDSIHQLCLGVFGIVLPSLTRLQVSRVTERLAEGLHDASGADRRFTFEIRGCSYPDEVTTARELEETARLSCRQAQVDARLSKPCPALVGQEVAPGARSGGDGGNDSD